MYNIVTFAQNYFELLLCPIETIVEREELKIIINIFDVAPIFVKFSNNFPIIEFQV